jgi:hypothetical protein
MIAAALASLLASASPAAPLSSGATSSFLLEQPEDPMPDDFRGIDEPLYGQTPYLRFARYGPPLERSEVFRFIRSARDHYRHSGLLISPEERVYEVAADDRASAEARLREAGLWAPRRTVLFSTGPIVAELDRVLGAGDPAAMRRRYAFPLPKPATDAFHRPAARDYRLTDEDRRLFEAGLEDAERMSPEIYPGVIPKVDAVLFDTESLEIYSYNHHLALPRVRTWRGYQVYRVTHHARPEEHEMAICVGGIEFMRGSGFRAEMGELYFACAGWGSFGRIQKERRSIYRYPEGYRASIVHEFGHQYQELLAGNPTPEMIEIQRRIDAMKLPDRVNADSAVREGFANWCELKGAKKLYPEQYRRMIGRLKASREDDAYGHEAGLAAAAGMVEKD